MRATFWPVLWLPAVHAVAAGMGVRSIARVAPARMSVAISDDNVEQRKNPALYLATAAARTDVPASSPPRMRRPAGKPEVLAPAGGWAQARAAVANGGWLVTPHLVERDYPRQWIGLKPATLKCVRIRKHEVDRDQRAVVSVLGHRHATILQDSVVFHRPDREHFSVLKHPSPPTERQGGVRASQRSFMSGTAGQCRPSNRGIWPWRTIHCPHPARPEACDGEGPEAAPSGCD